MNTMFLWEHTEIIKWDEDALRDEVYEDNENEGIRTINRETEKRRLCDDEGTKQQVAVRAT